MGRAGRDLIAIYTGALRDRSGVGRSIGDSALVLLPAWLACGRADFGVDPNALRERFGFYFDRFAIRAE